MHGLHPVRRRGAGRAGARRGAALPGLARRRRRAARGHRRGRRRGCSCSAAATAAPRRRSRSSSRSRTRSRRPRRRSCDRGRGDSRSEPPRAVDPGRVADGAAASTGAVRRSRLGCGSAAGRPRGRARCTGPPSAGLDLVLCRLLLRRLRLSRRVRVLRRDVRRVPACERGTVGSRQRSAHLPRPAAPTSTYAVRVRIWTSRTRHLEPVPLLERDGVVEVAVRAPVAGMSRRDGSIPAGALSVLARIRAGARSRRRTSAARCAARPSPTSTQHVVDVGTRSLMCTCRPCYLLFTHDDATLAYRAVPDRYLSFPDLRCPGLGRPGDPGRHGLLLHQLRAGAGRRVLSRAGGRDRVGAAAGRPGTSRRGRHPALATLKPDVEALLVRAVDQRVEAFLVPIDVCYELVGHLRMLWRGFDGGQDVRRRLDEFFATSGRVARRAAVRCCRDRRSRSRCSTCARSSTPRRRTCCSGCGSRSPAAPSCTRSRCAPSCGSSRSAGPTTPPSRTGLADLFGTPDRYASTLKPFLWTHATAMVQGFEGAREFDLPVACTYDFDVSATKYLHALRGGDVPLVLLFSGTVFTRGADRLRGRAALLVTGGAVPAAGGVLARADGSLLPGQRLDPAGPRDHRRARAPPVGARSHLLGADHRRPAAEPR